MDLTQKIANQVAKRHALSENNTKSEVNDTLRLLSKWRSALIQNTYLQNEGTKVFGGLFKGLDFLEQSAEGCHIPKLLGCYEQPIQPYIKALTNCSYTKLLNIGCSEGYYAVGLAKIFKTAISLAFDKNPSARNACSRLASKNHVSDRVKVEPEFTPNNFSAFRDERVLVFCDIEGAELDLFSAKAASMLSDIDLIIESHECFMPGITDTLTSRFAATHDITVVRDNGSRNLEGVPPWFNNLSNLDQLLSIWEWRSGPTPWLIMRAKAHL